MHVFLDVDGVLNKESDWRNKYSIDMSCVHALGTLCEEIGPVRIILISTWRAGIGKNGDTVQIDSLRNALARVGLSIDGQTPISGKGRQAEIEYYIRRNSVSKYIILDDDRSLFYDPDKMNLYTPDYKTGLTQKDVKAVAKMLARQNRR